MEPASRDSDSVWVFTQRGYDPACAEHFSTLFALANGTIGTRGAIDELPQFGASYLPDGFTRRPIAYHERFSGYADHTDTRLACPSGVAAEVLIDGVPIDFGAITMLSCVRELDLRAGILRRVTRWQLECGRIVEINADRLVPIHNDAVVVSHLRVRPIGFSARVTVTLPIRPVDSSHTDEGVHDPRVSAKVSNSLFQKQCAVDFEQAIYVFVCADDIVNIAVAQRLTAKHSVFADEVIGQRVEALCDTDTPLVVERYVAFAVDRDDGSAAILVASASALSAQSQGIEALSAIQSSTIQQFMATSAVSITDDPTLTRAIHFNLFHLFQSASRSDCFSIAAKGLTGEGYEGHYFWDTEAFVLPVLCLTTPLLARHILMYRAGTLNHARSHARLLNHKHGALFAWRTISGDECSSHYPTGSAQYHVNAAIAFAIEVYDAATGDAAFLIKHGAELLFETARIWLEIGHFSDRRGGAFCIHGVTGPDEYSALVDNDYYTNALAQRHLRYAVQIARRLADEVPESFAVLSGSLDLQPSEITLWENAAAKMLLPVDQSLGVSPQDDAFLNKPKFDLANIPAAQHPLLLHHHPMTLFRHQLCKQGDVVQAMVMAGDAVPLTLKARNFAYYEPLTTHDSTLSSTAFAILAVEIGEDQKAAAYHRQTAFVDIDNNHGNTGHGAHMAAMAGSWLTLVQGWGGLRIEGGALFLRPRCMVDGQGYSFQFRWRGSLIAVAVDALAAHYRIVEGHPISLHDHARPLLVTDAGITAVRPLIDGVIFDLDGVLTDTAVAHYNAWKLMCDEDGLPFDAAVNERLKGIDRATSLRIILDHAQRVAAPADFAAMMARKNSYYRQLIAAFTPNDLFTGVSDLLSACRRAGLKIGLASASRNAAELVERLGIASQFDYMADSALITNAKPDPEIFLTTAAALGIAPSRCVGVEDAVAGVRAINAAGMHSVGIGDPSVLSHADLIAPTIAKLNISAILEGFPAAEFRRQTTN